MLKSNNFIFLVVFLLCTLVACEKDQKETEVSCPEQEVVGGQQSGGSLAEDMGLEGGQSLDQESQPTGGSVEEEEPQGGELAGGAEELPVDEEESQGGTEEVPDPLPAGGAQLPEEPAEGGVMETTEEVSGGEVASEEDVPADGGALVEEEASEE